MGHQLKKTGDFNISNACHLGTTIGGSDITFDLDDPEIWVCYMFVESDRSEPSDLRLECPASGFPLAKGLGARTPPGGEKSSDGFSMGLRRVTRFEGFSSNSHPGLGNPADPGPVKPSRKDWKMVFALEAPRGLRLVAGPV